MSEHDDPLFDAGMAARRQVLGDAHVDRAQAAATPFTQPFQDYIVRSVWGQVWTRDGLDRSVRRLLTLALLAALGQEHELDMHVRAALDDGVPPEQIAEVFLQVGAYAGVPAANRAFAIGQRALDERRG